MVAHRRCNNDKRAALASVDHLGVWWDRFDPEGATTRQLDEVADRLAWPRQPSRTAAGARGLYHHQPAGTMLWAGPGRVEPLDPARLRQLFSGLDVAAEGNKGYWEA